MKGMKKMGNDVLAGQKQFHLRISKEDIGEYIILAGDPGRIPQIAERFENSKEISYNREFRVYTGYLCGQKISAVSTGIGGPSAAIAVEEAVKCGAHTFIRVGTSGGMALQVLSGDLVIATAAVRGDGTSKEYLPHDYPAVANFAVIEALKQSAQKLSEDEDGKRFHVGVIQSKDSFYGELEPETMPMEKVLDDNWNAYLRCGCLISEMECATIFSVGIARNVRMGAVLTAIWNVERAKRGLSNQNYLDNNRAIDCAIEAMKTLISNQ
ncbi:MAG: nucleoside phosphorylase [Bacillota bacterium]|nr:nucleoside phosphorylase [Bacillota bacterium]